jgi:hypothetical protein
LQARCFADDSYARRMFIEAGSGDKSYEDVDRF